MKDNGFMDESREEEHQGKNNSEAESTDERFEYEEYEEYEGKKRPSCLKKIVVMLVLLAFLAISIPNLPYLFSDKFNFLDQSQKLLEDDIVQRCKPAVVSVEAQLDVGTMQTKVQQGTGFNILPTGRIITNQHVVDGAKIIIIRFIDGRSYYSKSYEIIPDIDIAIISLEGADLPVIALNTEDYIQEGDTVTVIGNPLGFERIAQRGQIGKFHQIQDSSITVFDLDILLNPGNSGSPVLNSRAEAVGVVFAVTTLNNEGVSESRGLAIPLQALDSKYFI